MNEKGKTPGQLRREHEAAIAAAEAAQAKRDAAVAAQESFDSYIAEQADKTGGQLRSNFEASMSAYRAAQDAFELARGELRLIRENANRVQGLADEAARAAEQARESGAVALHAANGEMVPAVAEKRRAMRDAQDLAEDYRRLAESTAAAVSLNELPALRLAMDMENCRIKALQDMAEMELREALEKAIPSIARAMHLKNIVNAPDASGRHSRGLADGVDTVMGAIRTALVAADFEGADIPSDLASRCNIAPLQWSEAASPIYIAARVRAAGIRGAACATEQDAAQLVMATGLTAC